MEGSERPGASLGCSRCCEWAVRPKREVKLSPKEDLGQQCLEQESQEGFHGGGTTGPRGTAPGEARASERKG